MDHGAWEASNHIEQAKVNLRRMKNSWCGGYPREICLNYAIVFEADSSFLNDL